MSEVFFITPDWSHFWFYNYFVFHIIAKVYVIFDNTILEYVIFFTNAITSKKHGQP